MAALRPDIGPLWANRGVRGPKGVLCGLDCGVTGGPFGPIGALVVVWQGTIVAQWWGRYFIARYVWELYSPTGDPSIPTGDPSGGASHLTANGVIMAWQESLVA